MRRFFVATGLAAAALLVVPAGGARAEVAELRLARQYGISHLAMALIDVMHPHAFELDVVRHECISRQPAERAVGRPVAVHCRDP